MVGYAFTDDVRKSLQRARESAVQLGSQKVEPAHIVLGLTRVRGEFEEMLARLGTTSEQMASTVSGMAKGGGHIEAAALTDLPYTRAAKRVIEDAMSEARRLGHQYVGCEHLLLGLMVPASPVHDALLTAGLSTTAVEEILRGTITEAPAASPREALPTSRDPVARSTAVIALLLAVAALWIAVMR